MSDCTSAAHFSAPNRLILCALIMLGCVTSAAAQCDETELTSTFKFSVFGSMDFDGYRVVGSVNGAQAFQVFAFDGTSWQPEATLMPQVSADFRVRDVAISGDRIIVSMRRNDSGWPWRRYGAAFIFGYANGKWVQEFRIPQNEDDVWEDFPQDIDIDGDRAIVTRFEPNPPGGGSIYVFRRDGPTWVEETRLVEYPYWELGRVALDADLIVTGSNVKVYRRTGTNWVHEANLAQDTSHRVAVDASVGVIVVGDTVYRYDSGSWVEDGVLDTVVPVFVGDVQVDGDRIILSDYSHNSERMATVFVYAYDGTVWNRIRRIRASDVRTYEERFGRQISLQGQRAVVSASGHDGGVAFIFDNIDLAITDCNENFVDDACDIGPGLSNDCNGNGVPDECEDDCNGNRLADECDLAGGFSADCNVNGIPDECDISGCDGGPACEDCNRNGAPDGCDLDSGLSVDCNANAIPDECEVSRCDLDPACEECPGCEGCEVDPDCIDPDCDGNDVLDECDIADEPSIDCDRNGLIDVCEPCGEEGCGPGLGGLASVIPDACCAPPSPARGVLLSSDGGAYSALTANRFLVIEAGDTDLDQALRVTLVDLPPPYDVWNGATMWVGPPSEVNESSGTVNPVSGVTTFQAATLTCSPFYRDWSALGALHVFHEGIVPEGTYRVDVVARFCDLRRALYFSEPLTVLNPRHGDIVTDLGARPPSLPSGSVDIVDALAVLGKFANAEGSIRKARADLEPGCLDLKINVSDVLAALQGFTGVPYSFLPTAANPCDSTCANPLP